ncbi:uncharacterized protein LOC119228674 [Pungitius pungitius]|uniref:uncharacterized protein LOC119228674 n=1 Tax=Pungitius pungitius TaxID=134920 RepID=UPI002E13BE11
MNEQFSLNHIDKLLFQFALQTRELSQKKNEINQQIKVCRVDTAERRSSIDAMQRNIQKLEEEIRAKQSTVTHNKANAKSMKATNALLLQYEQTLKADLESRNASYNRDLEVHEERMASCRKTFQSHKEYYCKNPLAQKLLTLQAEKEEIESRIRGCDDQIAMKQKELDQLTGPAVNSFLPEKPPASVPDQPPRAEPEKQLDTQTEEESNSSIDISSLHLNQAKKGDATCVEANTEEACEENKVQYSSACRPSSADNELWSCQPLDEQRQPDEMHTKEQDGEESRQDDHVLQSAASAAQQEVEVEAPEVATDEEQAQSEDDNEGLAAVPSSPTFPFAFSPPRQGTSDAKSPPFLFSVNSDPSTPAFSGFGFDAGSSLEEESPFAFTCPFFNEKKTSEPKSSTCPEFLFGQPEQSEAFKFPFQSPNPRTTDKENTREDFPFSFNF